MSSTEVNNLKTPISMRLSAEALELMEALGKKQGVNRTAIVEIAVRQMAEREGVKVAEK